MKDKEMTKERILIVEDERIVAEDIHRTLKNLGYTVSSIASSAKEAIKEAEENKPNLILMDIKLRRDMEGVEAAKRIHARLDIPIVYITSMTEEATLQRAKKTEPFGYIKPFAEMELQTTIEMALYRHKMERKVKESEEGLRIMFESIGDGIIVTDLEANIIKVNNATLRMGGYSHKEELIGRNAIDFVSPNDRAKARENLSKELEVGHSKGDIEYALLAKDGSEFYVESNATVLHDSSGNLVGLINIIRDITDFGGCK